MFKNEFQGGPYFEIFSAQRKELLTHWKMTSGIKKVFDKEVRSFVQTVEGSAITTKLSIPKDPKTSLTLVQRYLILQLYIPKGQDFSLDLGVSDLSNQKRRLVLSTTYRETQTNPLHSKIPLGCVKKSRWLNLCLNLSSLVGETWQSQTYQCVDSLCISGNCRIRRIFTMKNQPPDTTDDEDLYGFCGINDGPDIDSIPKQCQLPPDVPQDVQVISVSRIRYYEGRGRPAEPLTSRTGASVSGEQDLNSSGGKKSGSQEPYHIAFGTKISGSYQPRKGSSKEGSLSSRQPKPSHSRSRSDVSPEPCSSSRAPHPPRNDRVPEGATREPSGYSTARDRKNSDPGANTEDPEVVVDKDSLRTSHTWTDGADNKESVPFVKPHPPRQPSSEKRRRPRVKSAGKERTQHTAIDKSSSQSVSSSAHSSMSSNHSQSQSRSNSGNKATRQEPGAQYQQPVIMASEDEVATIMREMQETGNHDYRRSETESEPSSHNTSGAHEADDSLSEVIQAINGGHDLEDLYQEESQEYVEDEGDIEDNDTGQKTADKHRHKIYTFSSRPKSISRAKLKTASQENARNKTRKKESTENHRKETHRRRHKAPSSGGFVHSNSSDDEDTEMTPRPLPTQRTQKQQVPPRKQDSKPQFSKSKQSSSVQAAFTSSELLQRAPVQAKSPHSSQTRMSISRKSLREIPKEELRKSGNQKPYNSTKYQMVDLSDSFEARMLASMRREQSEDGSSSEEDKTKQAGRQDQCHELHSLSGSSDETDMSTLKGLPKPNGHNYQDEMKILSQEFLTQSNPRDWGNVFSPPIVVSGTMNGATERLTAGTHSASPKIESRLVRECLDSDGDCELDLLYDPILNCYYDPKTFKYYELM